MEGAMRLSEAIRLGAMMTSAARWTFFENGGACALGGALRAVGVTPDESMTGEFNDRSLVERWRWAASDVRCPACENHGFVWFTIMHLNDDHEWPRDAIGQWVATIEPEDSDDSHRGEPPAIQIHST
jgi:hypothetical protein